MALIDLLGVVQEEAAEVIKEVSKVRRSGENFVPFADQGKTLTNIENLTTEILDFLVLLSVWESLHEGPKFSEMVDRHAPQKLAALARWSPEIFER